MKILYIKLGKERQIVLYNKTIGAFFSVNIKISQPSILRLTNPDVNLIRMHQLYDFSVV